MIWIQFHAFKLNFPQTFSHQFEMKTKLWLTNLEMICKFPKKTPSNRLCWMNDGISTWFSFVLHSHEYICLRDRYWPTELKSSIVYTWYQYYHSVLHTYIIYVEIFVEQWRHWSLTLITGRQLVQCSVSTE